MLFGNSVPAAVMSVLGAVLVVAAYWSHGSTGFLREWLGLMVCISLMRLGIWLAFRGSAEPEQHANRWLALLIGSVALSGLAWGCAGLMLTRGEVGVPVLIFCCIALGAILAASGNIVWWPAHLAFHMPVLLLTGTGFFIAGEPAAQLLGVGCFALCFACAIVGRNLGAVFGRIVDVSAENARLADQLRAQAASLTLANRQLRQISRTDYLTGIWNRRHMMSLLEAQRGPHAVLLMDIDHFKNFNDTLGHNAGDMCLKHVADAIDAVAAAHGGQTGRHGGEEFLVILPAKDEAGAMAAAEEIRRTIEHLHERPELDLSRAVTVSVGLVLADDDIPVKRRLGLADEALYAAKQQGRNLVLRAGASVTAS